MQRIESGDVTISGTDLQALLDIYGGFGPDETGGLVEDARIARRQRWWTKPEYREHLTPSTRKLMGFETEAVEIRTFQPGVVPAVLQTAATTDVILDEWTTTAERRRVQQEVRGLRRHEVLERDDPPRYYLVLDESVLLRNVGGVRIAAEQMAVLAAAAGLPQVRVRILPLDRGALRAVVGPFAVVNLDERDDDDAVLHREGWDEDSITDDPRLVHRHREYFEDMWRHSWDEHVSLGLIAARAAVLRSELDRARD
jgi:hypothetical protein